MLVENEGRSGERIKAGFLARRRWGKDGLWGEDGREGDCEEKMGRTESVGKESVKRV